MIERIIKEIESSLKHENYMAALSLALTLPDICGKAEYPNEGNGRRYIQWFDEYLGKYEIPPDVHDKENPSRIVNDTMPYMSGEIVYSLRNCFLHQGTPSIDKCEAPAREEGRVQQGREERDQFDGRTGLGGDRVRYMTGKLKRDNRTWAALVVTAEGERLDGMDDRTVYLPLSQLKFTENCNHEVIIHCPEWLIKKNNLNWHRISEIEAID